MRSAARQARAMKLLLTPQCGKVATSPPLSSIVYSAAFFRLTLTTNLQPRITDN